MRQIALRHAQFNEREDERTERSRRSPVRRANLCCALPSTAHGVPEGIEGSQCTLRKTNWKFGGSQREREREGCSNPRGRVRARTFASPGPSNDSTAVCSCDAIITKIPCSRDAITTVVRASASTRRIALVHNKQVAINSNGACSRPQTRSSTRKHKQHRPVEHPPPAKPSLPASWYDCSKYTHRVLGARRFYFFLRPAIEGTGDTDDQRAGVSNNFGKIQTKDKIACTGH